MLKWIILIFAALIAAFVMFCLALGQSQRRASLINGKSALLTAKADYAKYGHVTNTPNSSYRVWLSTNVVNIGGTQYQCFVEVARMWGWEGGTFAMTTNETLIWIDAQRRAKIVTLGHRPPLFGGPY